MRHLTVVEICAGGGGQALGLEQAGFEHVAAVELDKHACATLRMNRPGWHVLEQDVRSFTGASFRGVDLLAGGVPCPPFSVAGKQLGADDERDLFPESVRLAAELQPRAVLLENVRGLASPKFSGYREELTKGFRSLGYSVSWRLLDAAFFGVPQHRERLLMVALLPPVAAGFLWPRGDLAPRTVGDALFDLVSADGWAGAAEWAARAQYLAPTLVGGSHKHGGPDLGPTRARAAWAKLGVDGRTLADAPPPAGHPAGAPIRLTLRMAARLQGFPDAWGFSGGKGASYRQVGNAFPPPVARAVGEALRQALAG